MGLREQIRSKFRVAREMGDEMLVPCPHPDHEDRNPSASINIRKRLWVCYSCGRGGSLADLISGRIADENVEDMLAELVKKFTTPEKSLYPERWLDQFDAAGVHPYWLERGLSEGIVEAFRLGYDFESGRATYPLRTPSGGVVGVVKRATDDAQYPRYQYPGTVKVSETLFGYYKVQRGVRDVILTEGALDALAMWDVGLPAVAQMGARLSRTQTKLLRGLGLRSLTIAYDQDHAGREATERAVTNPLLNFCPLRLMTWDPRDGKDPLDLDPLKRIKAYDEARLVLGGT